MATILDIGFRESDLLQKGDTHCRIEYECDKIHIMKILSEITDALRFAFSFTFFLITRNKTNRLLYHAKALIKWLKWVCQEI